MLAHRALLHSTGHEEVCHANRIGCLREPDVWRRWLTLMLDGLRPEGAHPLP